MRLLARRGCRRLLRQTCGGSSWNTVLSCWRLMDTPRRRYAEISPSLALPFSKLAPLGCTKAQMGECNGVLPPQGKNDFSRPPLHLPFLCKHHSPKFLNSSSEPLPACTFTARFYTFPEISYTSAPPSGDGALSHRPRRSYSRHRHEAARAGRGWVRSLRPQGARRALTIPFSYTSSFPSQLPPARYGNPSTPHARNLRNPPPSTFRRSPFPPPQVSPQAYLPFASATGSPPLHHHSP